MNEDKSQKQRYAVSVYEPEGAGGALILLGVYLAERERGEESESMVS